MTSPIGRHVVAAEHLLVDRLQLRPLALPPTMAGAEGLWKDAPVRIVTRAWEGDAVGYMRIALVEGVQLSIGNLMVQARPNRPLPVLGADLVWLGAARDTMVAVDLSPMTERVARETDERLIASVLPDVHALPSGGVLPDWCATWFSASALYTRVPASRLGEALAMFDRYVAAWLALEASMAPQLDGADAVRARQHGYAEAHRMDDKGLRLLGTMFGRAWAEEYVRTVLFPETR